MNRSITNVIRFFMDECLPPLIRDSKYFMYPFYYFAYRGRNINQAMHFKSLVYKFTPDEYESFYVNLNTISRNRITDMNMPSVEFIKNNIDPSAQTLVDIGCGNGYLLKQIKKDHPGLQLTGTDIKKIGDHEEFAFKKGNIEALPFADKSIDIVTCCHTLEHILNPSKAIEELKRITKKQLFIVVPRQRYFYYTLDEHVNFFPLKENLTSLIDIEKHRCEKVWGDWVYLGNPE
jgi:ubiquinone/menaquinone biosynthesis C-methylase UbiE